ncbi:MAG: tRNA (guanosine(46)-N7)-methyltransferase TrmB [Clostridia bacterium]|nr:tRNA (guanosine(46)-N7)-methyltransferase TrmB [Clostridia bacterium]
MSRVRRKPGTKEALLAIGRPLVLEPEKIKGKWKDYFQNDRPIHIELGTGKGTFISTMAQQCPQSNYIGLELKEEILLTAIRKALGLNLPNLAFIWGDAKNLTDYFMPGELERIYINFCDPWPKTRHAKRRLTHANFLNIYNRLLIKGGEVHFKTDNQNLFEFSLNQFCEQGWQLKNITLDLYRKLPENNVATEYEQKFVEQGLKIYRLEAKTK